jgi:hypothetical protein
MAMGFSPARAHRGPGPLSPEPPRWSFRMLRFSRPGPRVLGVAVLAVATLLGLASPAPARPAAATPGPAASTLLPGDARDTLAYWTPARMAAAKPMAPPRIAGAPADASAAQAGEDVVEEWTGSQDRAPARTTGRLFFTLPNGSTTSCSASTVSSEARNLIATAGHCVFTPPGNPDGVPTGWHTDLLYVPGYRDGAAPAGRWPIARAFTLPRWSDGTQLRNVAPVHDLAFLLAHPDGTGRELVDVTGGNGIDFDTGYQDEARIFAYHPEASPERLHTCRTKPFEYPIDPAAGGPAALQSLCRFQPGSSGGPWLRRFDPATGTGTLVGVVSTGLLQPDGTVDSILSPSFGAEARKLFEGVRELTPRDVFVPVGQAGGYTTGLQVQNFSSHETTVRTRWIDGAGNTALVRDDLIGAGSSGEPLVDRGPAGADTAVRITPRAPGTSIGVGVNHIERAIRAVASSPGTAGGARRVHLPLLMRRNSATSTFTGTTTSFTVQNTEPVPARVTVTYFRPSKVETGATIPPFASSTFDQVDPGDRFGLPRVFSAKVESDREITATVFELQEQTGKGVPPTLWSYRGLFDADAGQTVAAPLVMANNGGNWTGVQVKSISDTPATVQLVYGPNSARRSYRPGAPPVCGGEGGGYTPAAVTVNLPAEGETTILQDPADRSRFPGGCIYIGSAIITSADPAGPAPLLAIVNQIGPSGGSAYEGIALDRAGPLVQLPLLQAGNAGIASGVQVQNVGDNAVTVTLSFGSNKGSASGGRQPCSRAPGPRSFPLAPEESRTIQLSPGDPLGFTELEENGKPCVYVGSATLSGPTGSRLAAMVNQLSTTSPGDKLSTYTGVSQAP